MRLTKAAFVAVTVEEIRWRQNVENQVVFQVESASWWLWRILNIKRTWDCERPKKRRNKRSPTDLYVFYVLFWRNSRKWPTICPLDIPELVRWASGIVRWAITLSVGLLLCFFFFSPKSGKKVRPFLQLAYCCAAAAMPTRSGVILNSQTPPCIAVSAVSCSRVAFQHVSSSCSFPESSWSWWRTSNRVSSRPTFQAIQRLPTQKPAVRLR